MAGHSKWANIRYRKSLQDAKRGKMFTKYIREITISARIGGGDLQSNPRLRSAIDKALSANMTRDTIERAVQRGSGDAEGQSLEEIRFEGYGPSGIAIVVDTATDNRKRTVSEVRHAFSKHAGNLGTDGSVMYLFAEIGQIFFEENQDGDALLELAMELGAEDLIKHEDQYELRCPRDLFHEALQGFKKAGFAIERADLALLPSVAIELQGEAAEKCLKLIDHLEDLDDVQAVHSNAEFPEELFP